MNRNKVRAVSLGCLVALSANTLTAFAQGAAQPRQAQPAQSGKVWVSQSGDGTKTEAQTFEFVIGDGQEKTISVAQGGFDQVTFGPTGTMHFFASEMSFDTQLVKGVPFSAVAVTETTQTLSDGNRIVRRTSSNIYRDGEGRTRREQALASVGPYTTADTSEQRVFINDPVAGVSYILDPRAQTAQKNSMPQIRMMSTSAVVGGGSGATTVVSGGTNAGGAGAVAGLKVSGGTLQGAAVKRQQPEYPAVAKAAGAQGPVQVQVSIDENGNVVTAEAITGHPLLRQAAIDAAKQWQFKPTELSGKPVKIVGTVTFNFVLDKSANTAMTEKVMTAAAQSAYTFERTPFAGGEKVETRRENLGKQKIEGVEAEGTKTVSTIPAGAIGNERAIEIVSERWYSPELQTVVMTRHSDPRTGESVYRLENVNRAEPPANLFQVPSDYSLNEPARMLRKKIEQ